MKNQKNNRKLEKKTNLSFFLLFKFFLKNRVNCLCFTPDGSQLLAAVGTRILVYETANGQLKSALSGMKFILSVHF